MNSSMQAALQQRSPLIERGADIFRYLRQFADEYALQNIKFFDTEEQDDDVVSLLLFGSIYPNLNKDEHETNINYFAVLQELKSSTAPNKWILIDCSDVKIVGLCDLLFKMFRELKNDFDIAIPSCQPNGELCLIGFGDRLVPTKPENDTLYKSPTITYFLEKMAKVMQLDTQRKFDLTQRELECINWVGEGKTSSEIGTILSISINTVDKHVGSVCQKLNAVNRIQMIAKAVRLGLI